MALCLAKLAGPSKHDGPWYLELPCPGLLEGKFNVITLKQNRPHNIIIARYSFYIDGLSSSLRERFNENPSFLRCFLSCLLTTRPKSIRLRTYSRYIYYTILPMQLGCGKFSHRSSKPGKFVRASSERPSLPKCAQRHPDYYDTARN